MAETGTPSIERAAGEVEVLLWGHHLEVALDALYPPSPPPRTDQRSSHTTRAHVRAGTSVRNDEDNDNNDNNDDTTGSLLLWRRWRAGRCRAVGQTLACLRAVVHHVATTTPSPVADDSVTAWATAFERPSAIATDSAAAASPWARELRRGWEGCGTPDGWARHLARFHRTLQLHLVAQVARSPTLQRAWDAGDVAPFVARVCAAAAEDPVVAACYHRLVAIDQATWSLPSAFA